MADPITASTQEWLDATRPERMAYAEAEILAEEVDRLRAENTALREAVDTFAGDLSCRCTVLGHPNSPMGESVVMCFKCRTLAAVTAPTAPAASSASRWAPAAALVFVSFGVLCWALGWDCRDGGAW